MKFKELALISLVLVILSLAAVSASDLNQTTISHSSSDASLVVDSVTDASSDASLAVNIPVTDSKDCSIIDNPDSKDSSISDASSTIDETIDIDNTPKDDGSIDNTPKGDGSINDNPKDGGSIDNNPIDNVPIDSDITDDDSINGDITPDDSIIRNMTNDSPVYNFDNSPITLSGDGSYFQNLQSVIDQLPAGSVLILSHDYIANCDFQIDINKDITIDGQGHTLNCNGLCRAFDSVAGNIVLKNLKITNGHIDSYVSDDETNNGGAIWITSNAKYTIENCTFTNCWADDMGGAIYNGGKNELTVIGCLFNNNTCDDVDGGAIFSIPPVYVENSTFKNNHAYRYGGAINLGTFIEGKNCLSNIIGCVFENNDARKYGGGINSWGHLFIDSCRFNSNSATNNGYGGGIYCHGNLIVENSNFTNNVVDYSGGAIGVYGNSSINNCIFESNKADGQIVHDSQGGAVFAICDLYVNNSTFKNNFADDMGGAICTLGNLYINWNQADGEAYNTFFISNKADDCYGGAIECCKNLFVKNAMFSSNSAYIDGGAVRIWEGSEFIHCLFDSNKCAGASSHCRGGAIYSKSTINSIIDCIFQKNYAEDYGGAVFSEETVNIYNCTFSHNSAENHGGAVYGKNVNVNQDKLSPQSIFIGNNAVCDNGGAIYATEAVKVFNAFFGSNEALVDGGAIFSKGTVNVDQCTFDSNRAMEAKTTPCYGGAIRGETVSATNSLFKDNYAENHGGAIFADYISKLQNVSFIDNHARKDGGAIYINKGCTITISQCSFINNLADGKGGAIYLDSVDSKLSINNNLFAYNEAKDGHAVFNYGSYGDIVNNWWGDEPPSKSNNMLVEWELFGSNENHVDKDPLRMVLRFDKDTVKVGDIVRATFYFIKSDGSIFTGEMPFGNVEFILPLGFEVKNTVFGLNSAYIEFTAAQAGDFDIFANLFWKKTGSTLHVLEAPAFSTNQPNSSLNQNGILSSQLVNPNIKNIVPVSVGKKLINDKVLNAGSYNRELNSNGLRLDCNGLKTVDFKSRLNDFNSDNYLARLTQIFLNCQFDNGFKHFELKSIINPTDNLEGADFNLNSAFSFVLSLFNF